MSITMAEAQKIVDAGVAKSRELGYNVTIAVVDAAGEIAAIGRMDGSGAFNFDLSYGLAFTAAKFGQTGEQLSRFADRNWFRALSVMREGRVMVAKGALPIRRGDQLIGGVGVSGAPVEADFEIAEAGIAALS